MIVSNISPLEIIFHFSMPRRHTTGPRHHPGPLCCVCVVCVVLCCVCWLCCVVCVGCFVLCCVVLCCPGPAAEPGLKWEFPGAALSTKDSDEAWAMWLLCPGPVFDRHPGFELVHPQTAPIRGKHKLNPQIWHISSSNSLILPHLRSCPPTLFLACP